MTSVHGSAGATRDDVVFDDGAESLDDLTAFGGARVGRGAEVGARAAGRFERHLPLLHGDNERALVGLEGRQHGAIDQAWIRRHHNRCLVTSCMTSAALEFLGQPAGPAAAREVGKDEQRRPFRVQVRHGVA
jgi:hypothetical protein